MVRFGVPGQNIDTLSYADGRLSTVPTIDAPRDPTVDDKKFPIQTIWRNNVTFRECMLVGFASNGDATWVCFTDSDGTVLELSTDVSGPVQPAGGTIDVTGTSVYSDGTAANTLTLNVQATANTFLVGAGPLTTPTELGPLTDGQLIIGATGLAPAAGSLVSGDGSVTITPGANSIDLSVTGNPVVDSIDVDFNTGPGTDPVVPSAAGQVSVVGRVIANTPANLKAVSTHSTAVNQFSVDVQLSAAVAATPADAYEAGIASFDNSHFSVDSNGFTKLLFPFGPTEGAYNLSLTANAGTGVVSIQGADGTALSATAPGYVTIASKASPGQRVTIPITANQSFIDDRGASEIIGNLFGLTTGIAHTDGIVFWVYAVLNDDEDAIQFMISRSPWGLTSPAAADIGAPDDAVADKQSSFWSFDNIDETKYDSNPALMIGSLLCTMTSSDDWTITDPGNQFGLNRFGGQKIQTMTEGQFGSASGTFFLDNGGTAPVVNTGTDYLYQVNPVTNEMSFYLDLPVTTKGVGAVTAQMALPYIVGPNASTSYDYMCTGSFWDNSAGTWSVVQMIVNDDTQIATFWLQGAAAAMLNTDFDASDILRISGTMPISTDD